MMMVVLALIALYYRNDAHNMRMRMNDQEKWMEFACKMIKDVVEVLEEEETVHDAPAPALVPVPSSAHATAPATAPAPAPPPSSVPSSATEYR
jgi:hypothetical protein